ncbi:MerR family transcriptional regulator [Loigolactobacillus binensis]|uniref:MerR family transcriptional regulator n=1 Tax=Loigolactobacillus binensis TaxID=2559922 RepID=A0ABW3EF77_9LACO|nr:MerR family transcriptional regulator [Loigolactobacillus binensis]
MNSEFDFIQRVKAIAKQEKFVLGIGELATATGVSQRQLRYWETKGYIQAEHTAKTHQHRKYSYFTLMKVYMIQSYMTSGFTLNAAVEKAEQHEEMAQALRRLIGERLLDFRNITEGYELDFGQIEGLAASQHLILVLQGRQPVKFELRAVVPE